MKEQAINAKILRAAARQVRAGWVQGAFRTDDGRVCGQAALRDAIFAADKKVHYGRMRALDLLIRQALVGKLGVSDALTIIRAPLIIFNDLPGQTAEAVAEVLEAAARVAAGRKTISNRRRRRT